MKKCTFDKETLEAFVRLFETAAETGSFVFDEVEYFTWLNFMKCHAKIKSIDFGSHVRSPALVAELKRLAGVARDLLNSPAA